MVSLILFTKFRSNFNYDFEFILKEVRILITLSIIEEELSNE